MGILRFMNVGADRGSGAQKLFCQNGFVLSLFSFTAKDDDLLRKCFGMISQGAFCHTAHLESGEIVRYAHGELFC